MAFLYLLSAKFRRILQSRYDALVWVLGISLHIIVDVAVIFAVYRFIPQIEGFDMYTCILIYSMYGIVTSVFYTLFPWTLWFSRSYVIDGNLITILTKPVSPLSLLIAQDSSAEELIYLLVRVLVYLFVVVKLEYDVLTILALSAGMIPGVMTIAGIFLLVACVGSRFPGAEEAFSPVTSLSDFSRYPTSIYPKALRIILNWIIPYSLIAFVPVSLVFGIDISDLAYRLWWLPLYGVGIFMLGYISFSFTIRRYESTGT